LVKRLVEMHGGRVEARSEGPGKGSEFVVRLPVLTEPASTARQTRRVQSGTAPMSSHRVLIVDDNRDAADSLAMMMQMTGNDARTAYDGAEAVRLAKQFRPEVVLLDIGLPIMDGCETARAIRSEPWGKEILLIAVTGWGQDDDRRQSSEAGFDHHLVKPVDPSALMEILASWEGRRPT
jgi:CheY-like chemotaxis protein